MLRRALAIAAALLVLFHIWLFAGQALEGQLSDPGLVFRWMGAGGLAVAWMRLRRHGRARLFGRGAVAIWVLALLLHGPAIAGRVEDFSTPPLPAVAATLAQIAASAAAVGLLFGFGRARAYVAVFQPLIRAVAVHGATRARSSGLYCLVAPRPPPLA